MKVIEMRALDIKQFENNSINPWNGEEMELLPLAPPILPPSVKQQLAAKESIVQCAKPKRLAVLLPLMG